MKAFFKKHDSLGCLLDWIVLVMVIGGAMYLLSKVLPAGVLFENSLVALTGEISMPVLFLYFQLIRTEASDRIDYWYNFFNFCCYSSGIILALHSLFGIYSKSGEQVSQALWELDNWNARLFIFGIEAFIFILCLLLYFVSKRQLWKFPRSPKQ
ncbi:hypothetical protein ACVRZ8_10375 [Streptococcus dentiloxodontae]